MPVITAWNRRGKLNVIDNINLLMFMAENDLEMHLLKESKTISEERKQEIAEKFKKIAEFLAKKILQNLMRYQLGKFSVCCLTRKMRHLSIFINFQEKKL